MRLHLMIAFLSIGFSGFLPAQEVSPGSGTGVRGGNIEGDQPQVRDSSGKEKGDDGQVRRTESRGMVKQWLRMDSDQDQITERVAWRCKELARVVRSDGAIDVRELTAGARLMRAKTRRRTNQQGSCRREGSGNGGGIRLRIECHLPPWACSLETGSVQARRGIRSTAASDRVCPWWWLGQW